MVQLVVRSGQRQENCMQHLSARPPYLFFLLLSAERSLLRTQMQPNFFVSSESFLHLVARHGNTEMVEYLLVSLQQSNTSVLEWRPTSLCCYESKMAPRQWQTNLYSLLVEALYNVYLYCRSSWVWPKAVLLSLNTWASYGWYSWV